MRIISRGPEETGRLAADFLTRFAIRPGRGRAAIVGLVGALGAGKTAFVQAAARALGIKTAVQSPTFVIIKTYPIRKGESLPDGKDSPCQWPWRCLVHIDCYRLASGKDLIKLGWRELAADAAKLIMIEWPERIKEILPNRYRKITFEILSETERKIFFPF